MFTSDKPVIDCEQPLPGSRIGHAKESETFAIHTHACGDLQLCDSPGLNETKGNVLRVVVSML